MHQLSVLRDQEELVRKLVFRRRVGSEREKRKRRKEKKSIKRGG